MSSAIGRIPESLIQEILARVDIVELVGQSLKLKKTGANYSGLCPFHNEKTPSFSVSATKQFYHCFGCGAHGDAIAFLMEREGLTFVESLEQLSQRVGIELPRSENHEHYESLKPLYQVLKQATVFYHQQWKAPSAQSAIAYLKDRGLDKDTVNRFAIGLAPQGWENLVDYFKSIDVDIDLLKKVGLTSDTKRGTVVDRFRHRIMFPIRDLKGRVLGFGGRALGDDSAKYLNSPETQVFHKSDCLYGLFEAKQHRGERIVLVEGYMDVVALAQYNIPALATLGTAVHENHLKHLFRYFNHVVFCFDGDKAGQGAAWKACLECMPIKNDERQIDFVFLPEKEDPDSYIRQHGRAKFLDLLDSATPFSEYFFEVLAKEIPPTNLDNKARLVKKAQPYLNQLPKSVFRSMMFERLNQWRDPSDKPKKSPLNVARGRVAPARGHRLKKTLSPAQWIALLLTRHPQWQGIVNQPERFLALNKPGIELLQAVLAQLEQEPDLTMEQRHQKLVDLNPDFASPLSATPWELLAEELLEEQFVGALARLETEFAKNMRKKLLEKAKNGELSEEEKKQLKKFHVFGN